MKMLISGAAGRMGGEMLRYARNMGAEAYGADIAAGEGLLGSLSECPVHPDVLVDFSFRTAIYSVLEYAVAQRVPCVVCTTGFLPRERFAIEAAAREIALLCAPNASLGTAAFIRAVCSLAAVFPQADIAVTEIHRRGKADAPSGTALMIAGALSRVHGGETDIHSLRMGEEVGTHEVMIATPTQTITLRHTAHSRALFAEGAYAAASFIIGREAGYYTMDDLISGSVREELN